MTIGENEDTSSVNVTQTPSSSSYDLSEEELIQQVRSPVANEKRNAWVAHVSSQNQFEEDRASDFVFYNGKPTELNCATSHWHQLCDCARKGMKAESNKESTAVFFMSEEWGRPVFFAASCIFHSPGRLYAFLQEVGPRHHQRPFGECRDGPGCAMRHDCTVEDFPGRDECRHWLYFSKRHVYLDGFVDYHDHRLSLALCAHFECQHEVEKTFDDVDEKKVTLRSPTTYAVKSWCRFSKCFKGGLGQMFKYAQVGLLSLSAIQLSVDREQSQRSMQDLSEFSYGIVRVFKHQEGQEDQNKYQQFHGFVLRCYEPMIIIDESVEKLNALDPVKIEWYRLGDMTTHVRCFTALDSKLYRKPGGLRLAISERKLINTPNESGTQTEEFLKVLKEVKERLTPDQFAWVWATLTKRGIHFTRGPAGCGKTSALCALIKLWLLMRPNERIFVVSATNAAIEENARRLIDGFIPEDNVLKVGRGTSSASNEFDNIDLEKLLEPIRKQHFGTNKKATKKRNEALHAKRHELLKRKVIIGTLAAFGKEEMRLVDANLLLVDEATKTQELLLVVAQRENIQTMLNLGDPNQMMSFTHAEGPDEFRFGEVGREHKIQWSLHHAYERWNGKFEGFTMHHQFRYHPAIGRWIQTFYDYPLQHMKPDVQGRLRGMEVLSSGKKLNDERIVIVDTKGPSDRPFAIPHRQGMLEMDHNRQSEVEVRLVLQMLRQMHAFSTDVHSKMSVLVMTPYRNQVAWFTAEMEASRGTLSQRLHVEIATVDSCQGREADCVLVSMVRSSRNGEIGFLQSAWRRTLVTLSRAREYVFVVMDRESFIQDDVWRKLFATLTRDSIPALEIEDTRPMCKLQKLESEYWCEWCESLYCFHPFFAFSCNFAKVIYVFDVRNHRILHLCRHLHQY